MEEKVLYPHNQRAIEAVRASFETENRACVVHPTGTGKSFIIEGVAKDYPRVVVFAANTETLNAVRERDIDGEFRTYQSLLTQDSFEPDQYDLIVLDEFHRAGAEQWSLALEDFLNANPDAKVFGTSATPVRYLDGARDMSEELFNGNVVSRMDITDAWIQGIIPVPKYVTALPSYNVIEENYERYVNSESFRGDESEKARMRDLVEQGRVDWQSTYGAEAVLKRHLDGDTRKMIVFCDSIESCGEMSNMISDWLSDRNVRSYIVNSKNPDAGREMQAFRNDDYDGLKIIFTVDMLNEGVHVDDVDAVIMFRQTQSPTVYLQQLGRCLSAGKDRQPIIFDFVDNISINKTRMEKSFVELSDTFQKKCEAVSGDRESRKDDIIFKDLVIEDNLLSFRELLTNFNLNIRFEDRLQALYDWVNEHGRLPLRDSNDKEEKSLGYFVCANRTRQEIVNLRKKYPSKDRLQVLYDWVNEHGRLPLRDSNDKEEKSLGQFVDNNRTRQEIVDLREKFPSTKKSFDDRLQALYDWVNEHGRLPSMYSNDKEEKSLGHYVYKNRTRQEIVDLREKFPSKRQSFDDRLQVLYDWVHEYGRLPTQFSIDKEEKSLGDFVCSNRTRQEIVNLREKFPSKRQSFEDRIQVLYGWVNEHGRLPSKYSNDKEEKSLGVFIYSNRTRKEIVDLREKNSKVSKSLEQNSAMHDAADHKSISGTPNIQELVDMVNNSLNEYDPNVKRTLSFNRMSNGFELHYDNANHTVRRADFDLEKNVMNIYSTKEEGRIVGVFDLKTKKMVDLRKAKRHAENWGLKL